VHEDHLFERALVEAQLKLARSHGVPLPRPGQYLPRPGTKGAADQGDVDETQVA